MPDKNTTKKQHYVPKFYLKNFSNENSKLEIIDLDNERMLKNYHYSAVCYSDFFYGNKTGIKDKLSQDIEDWLKIYEDIISDALPRIIKKILNQQQINADDRYILSALMCQLYLRTPSMRTRLNKMQEDMFKHMAKINADNILETKTTNNTIKMDSKSKEDIRKMIEDGSYSLKFNNANHIKFMIKNFGFGEPGFTNLFFAHSWEIYIAKGKNRFITTDNPLVEWWQPRKIIYGPSFLERNKYFSLTPEIFIVLTHPKNFDLQRNPATEKIRRKTIFEDKDIIVSVFNLLLAVYATRFAYSKEKRNLENIILGRHKPGDAEKIYYKQFEMPWHKARIDGYA